MGKIKVKSKQNGHAAMPAKKTTSSAAECVSGFVFWTDKHGEKLEKIWKRVPEHLGQLIATLAMFILGLTVRG